MERLITFTAVLALGFSLQAQTITADNLEVVVDSNDGHIREFTNLGTGVQFRQDEWIYGPAFEDVTLRPSGNLTFRGEKGPLEFTLKYGTSDSHLLLTCSIRNNGADEYVTPLRERLKLGVNSEMISYPQWDWAWFPTMIRCEKDFCWGYFGATSGEALAFASDAPVASYGLNYIYDGKMDWMWGHRIYSAGLDLLHCLPLPRRHPQKMDRIAPGQTLEWNIHIGVVKNNPDIQRTVSGWASVPQIECSAYTVTPGQDVTVSLMTAAKATVTYPDGRERKIHISRNGKAALRKLSAPGLYTIKALSPEGKCAEACIYVRRDWDWYLRNVRNHIADNNLPIVGSSCEQYYGYGPAFKAARLFPDSERDGKLEERFVKQLPALIDTATGIPHREALPHRIQNFSTLISQLCDLWKATGRNGYLRIASRIGDYLCSVQADDGSYRCNETHYTAVIYPAKSMFDLADSEREAGMTAEAERHRTSALRACRDLENRLDNIETEGDMTFEDGMITCSTLQLAYAALHCPENSEERAAFTKAAEYMMAKHRCLEQNVIPDCRMHGCTERYWEAFDTYFMPNQVMESPHGWTAWKLYAVKYLYDLTGKEDYLNDFLDTAGACAQLMTADGELRWAFLVDPYVDAMVCVPDDGPEGWKQERRIIGEQYMPQVSIWFRPDDEFSIVNFGEKGGAGDGTVYEIFNAIADLCL